MEPALRIISIPYKPNIYTREKITVHMWKRSRDSSVRIVIRLQSGWSGVLFPAEAENFSLGHGLQTGSEVHTASYPTGDAVSFTRCRAAAAWSWPLDVWMSISVIIIRVRWLTEMDIETSVYYVHLTRLIAREDFIKFTRRESTKTYIPSTSSWCSA
jgi:hypothetical protein